MFIVSITNKIGHPLTSHQWMMVDNEETLNEIIYRWWDAAATEAAVSIDGTWDWELTVTATATVGTSSGARATRIMLGAR